MTHSIDRLCRRLFVMVVAAAAGLAAVPAFASDIGVSPVSVHLDKANDRATLNVINNGTEPVVMQAEMIQWKRVAPQQDEDGPTTDMIVNPAVFTVAPGQTQVVRVGMRKAAQATQEGTYRIVLREVPTPPKEGEARLAGQVRVLMALRVPVYVAPLNVVKAPRFAATREADGTVVASLQNDGNVHVRVGRLRVRADGDPTAVPSADQAVAEVVFPGENRKFRVPDHTAKASDKLTLEIATDQGPYEVGVALAGK